MEECSGNLGSEPWYRPANMGRIPRIDDVAEVARRLFDGLISLDAKGVEGIIVEGVGEEREGLAVMNRVQKAAGRVCWIGMDS